MKQLIVDVGIAFALTAALAAVVHYGVPFSLRWLAYRVLRLIEALRAIPRLMLVLARACEVGAMEFHRRRNDDVRTLVAEQEGL